MNVAQLGCFQCLKFSLSVNTHTSTLCSSFSHIDIYKIWRKAYYKEVHGRIPAILTFKT